MRALFEMKLGWTIVVVGVVGWAVLPMYGAPVNAIRAIVNDTVITEQQVLESAAPALELLFRQYGTQREEYLRRYSQTVSNAMEQLVERQLILHDFKTAGYNLPETLLDEIAESRIRARFGDRATAIKTLRAEGMTYERFRQRTRELIIVEILTARNVRANIIISPHKIEAYYDAHREKFKVEDQVKLRMIVLDRTAATTPEARKNMAEEIRRRIQQGAAFSEMAAVYSTGSQRVQGGDWGWVERSVLRKDLAEIAFALPPNQCSEVIETPEACYLMWVEEKRPAHIRPLSELRDEIEKTLLIEERARLHKKWIDRLKSKTFVVYFPAL